MPLERDPAEERPEFEDLQGIETLVVGCGNVLLGDDGAGPAAVKLLETEGGLPENVGLLDAGTGIRPMLFNVLLSEKRPKRIIVLDAVDVGRKPGEVFEIDLESVPAVKLDDFSLHQLPTSNMLKELRDHCGIEVKVLAVQAGFVPDAIQGGLSPEVSAAIPELCRLVRSKLAPEKA